MSDIFMKAKIHWKWTLFFAAIFLGTFAGQFSYNVVVGSKLEKQVIKNGEYIGTVLKGTLHCLQELEKMKKEKALGIDDLNELDFGYDGLWKDVEILPEYKKFKVEE